MKYPRLGRMPQTKPRPVDKSPLHPSALRVRDVHPGVSYVTFHTEFGVIERGVFTSAPYVARMPGLNYTEPWSALAAHVRTVNGKLDIVYLESIGIDRGAKPAWRYMDGFSPYQVTVRASKAHLLPAPSEGQRQPISGFRMPASLTF